jgi:hypothetical protein
MYRIYTEDVNRAGIENIIKSRVSSFTIIPAIGYWNDKRENSLIIEFANSKLHSVEIVAELIKQANNQESVLITETEETVRFV